MPHDIVASEDKTVFVGDVHARTVWKFASTESMFFLFLMSHPDISCFHLLSVTGLITVISVHKIFYLQKVCYKNSITVCSDKGESCVYEKISKCICLMVDLSLVTSVHAYTKV